MIAICSVIASPEGAWRSPPLAWRLPSPSRTIAVGHRTLLGYSALLAVTRCCLNKINASVPEDESVWLPRYHLYSPIIISGALVPGLCGAASRLRCNGLARAVLFSLRGGFLRQLCQTTSTVLSWGGSQSRALLLCQAAGGLLLLAACYQIALIIQSLGGCVNHGFGKSGDC